MSQEIRVILNSERHPELFQFFKESEKKPLQVLEHLIHENERLKLSLDERQNLMEDFSKIILKELIPIRLALRTTEKQTWLLSQLKNTEILERAIYEPNRPYPLPQTVKERRSEPFSILDTVWEDYIRALQVERASRTTQTLEHYEKEWEEE